MQISLFKNFDKPMNFLKDKVVNVASVPLRSPFRYPGGKTWFIPTFRRWVKNYPRKPEILLEPFAGGGIIGLTAAFENLVKKVVLVELDEEIAAVWETIIHGDFEKLAKKILNFEMKYSAVKDAIERDSRNTLEKAFQTILKNRISHGGIMAPGSGLMKNGENGKGLRSRWYPETLAKRILDIGLVRSRISFIRGSAFDIIPEYVDDKDSLIFIDPPYTAGGKRAGRRLYKYYELDHDKLFDLVAKSKADFLFTYDDSNELRKKAEQYRFEYALVLMKNTHHATMSELVIGKKIGWLKNEKI
ncbi:MAG: DNA adenine methylase [Deltaproteobacteria bacterium]